MGDFEAESSDSVESTLRYHPDYIELLTVVRYPETRQSLVGSLTGAVASQRVTEAYKGHLRLDGNQLLSALA